ncbi:hypothetical protein DN068_17645 [Taibaiella soli]|uniref:Uncharacterized protein n=1 Tax=Taibaiella soli TaxID=1649169 RepID=A0A2W2AW16_9BACT|nr:hypothetical protein DN068_17645 [Taibaiella soli]
MIAFFSCNKYAAYSGTGKITGYIKMIDETTSSIPSPLGAVTVFLHNNKSNVTSSYEYETVTDDAGYFSVSNLDSKASMRVFVRFTKDGVEYASDTTVTVENAGLITMYVRPKYTNGLVLHFSDSTGGSFSNVAFRIYTSGIAASMDSSAYAFINTRSDSDGNYRVFNLQPQIYYIVAKDSFGANLIGVNDTVLITSDQVRFKNVPLK